jgi:hypothetical protein
LAIADELDPIVLTDLVGLIYESALDPKHWDEFLTALEAIYPGARITLFGHENGRPCEALTIHKNFPADDLRAYVDHHVTTSPYLARVNKVPVGRAVYPS